VIKPDPRIIQQLASIATQHPDVVVWLEQWRQHELEQLPYATNSPALYQGRCQTLNELVKFVKESPTIMAKSR
jgi:hypothetical protein